MNVFIRADASINIGVGHVMRCLTLAKELHDNGATVHFICRELQGNLITDLRDKGIKVYPLALYHPPEQRADGDDTPSSHAFDWRLDARATSDVLQQFQDIEWLVVDHYDIDARWEKVVRGHVKKIMIIDDLADRRHDCDLLLDQNFSTLSNRYDTLLPANCRQLLGPKYALIRQEFLATKGAKSRSPGKAGHILVSFGGTDPTNETAKVISALEEDISADIVLGSTAPHRAEIQQQVDALPHVTLHIQPENVAWIMAQADIAIGAGGSTMWERCTLGLPSIVIITADNQRQGTEALATKGYILSLGSCEEVTTQDIRTSLQCLLANPSLAHFFSSQATRLVDGKGTHRVAVELSAPMIILQQAEQKDCKNIFEWRNAAEVRNNSFDRTAISWDDHQRWYENTLHSTTRHLLIGSVKNDPIGVLRYDHVQENEMEVSIYLTPGNTGKGLGPHLLNAGSCWVKKYLKKVSKISAQIIATNNSSLRAFQKAGFKPIYHQMLYLCQDDDK